MARRGNKEGSVYRRADGRWVGAVTVGYNRSGNPRRKVVYGQTRAEVGRKLAELVAQAHRGSLAQPQSLTLRDWLLRWLELRARELRASSIAAYRYELSRALPSLDNPHLSDALGHKRLQAIRPTHIRAFLDSLALPARGIRMVRSLLRSAFEEAVALEIIHRNPVQPVRLKLPPPTRQGRVLEPGELGLLLAALDAHPTPVGLALRLMLACGLRRGEALGLKWGDLNLDAQTLAIRRAWTGGIVRPAVSPTKNRRSERLVPVPTLSWNRLIAYRRQLLQAGFSEATLIRMWLFPSSKDPSRPVEPNAPNHALRRICNRLNLSPIRVHDLRHTYGSLLLARGAPVELVSERLGHSTATMTLNVYRHLLDSERQGWVIDVEEVAR